MTVSGPGWYADPQGSPGAYRWWDGVQWTEAVTRDPRSPPPGAHGAPPPSQSSSGTVPPPPGAPGPGYLPYASGGPPATGGPYAAGGPYATGPYAPGNATTGPPTEVLSAGEGTRDRRGLLIIGAVVLALVAAGGVYLGFFRSGDTGAAERPVTGSTTPEQSPPEDSSTPADEASPDQPSPSAPTAPDQDETLQGPRLEFTPLPEPWLPDSAAADVLPAGVAQTRVTEARYNGRDSWVALLATGMASTDWYTASDLAGSAEKAATWFASNGFTGAKVSQRTQTSKPVRIDGRPAHLLKQHFSYRVDGLKARGEMVTFVVVDLGADNGGGAFLASVPDTHADLRTDVRTAMESLTIVE